MDLRVMSPSGFQDGRRSSAAFLTTLPRCGASEGAGIFSSSPGRGRRQPRNGPATKSGGLAGMSRRSPSRRGGAAIPLRTRFRLILTCLALSVRMSEAEYEPSK
jgi:hypothetical protein